MNTLPEANRLNNSPEPASVTATAMDLHRMFPREVPRREFLKTCLTATALMGLPFRLSSQVVKAAESAERPPVVWLHFQECTGCSESLLRSSHPTVSELILDLISLIIKNAMAGRAGKRRCAIFADESREIFLGGKIPARGGIFCKVRARRRWRRCGRRRRVGSDPDRHVRQFQRIRRSVQSTAGRRGNWSETIINISVVLIPIISSTILYYLTFKRLPELTSGPSQALTAARFTSIASGGRILTRAGLRRPTATRDTRRVIASTNWAAKGRPPTRTVRCNDSMTSASGRCPWAIPASAAPSRTSCSSCRLTRRCRFTIPHPLIVTRRPASRRRGKGLIP